MGYVRGELAAECYRLVSRLYPKATLESHIDSESLPGAVVVTSYYINLNNGVWWLFKLSTISKCSLNQDDPWIDMAYQLNLLDDDTIRRIAPKIGLLLGEQNGGICIQM